MTENNNHKNFLLKNAINNPQPNQEIIIPLEDSSEGTVATIEGVINSEEPIEILPVVQPEVVPIEEKIEGLEEAEGLEELDNDLVTIEIPTEIINMPINELNSNFDYKRLEDRISGLSTRLNKLQESVESFNATITNIHETLPKTLVKEADERITKHLGEHIDENIKANFGSLKEQLSQAVKILVAQGGVMNQCMTGMCNYIHLLMVKNKITEMQLSMLKGTVFNENSKKQLEEKLKIAHNTTKRLPLKGILQMANSLGDGTFNKNPASKPTIEG